MVAAKHAAAPAQGYGPMPKPFVNSVGSAVPSLPSAAPRPAAPRPVPGGAAQRTHPNRILTSLLLTGVVVFGLVLLNIYLAQTSFRLSDVQSQVSEQRSMQRQLRSEVATAESPERIAQLAKDLGLVVPTQSQPLD